MVGSALPLCQANLSHESLNTNPRLAPQTALIHLSGTRLPAEGCSFAFLTGPHLRVSMPQHLNTAISNLKFQIDHSVQVGL